MKSIYLPVIAILLSACSANELTSQGAKIRIIDNPNFVTVIEAKCEWKGEISASQGNYFTADLTSEANMMEGARNTLRNKAANLGANTVIIKAHSAVASELGTNGHSYVGQAYKC